MANHCWNTIGVRGDGSCVELQRHVHCHNCPVYSGAAQALLDRDASAGDILERTGDVARPRAADEDDARSVLIFRVAGEWLALSTAVIDEVADLRPIHSVPHRRGGAVLGVANIRGELLVCVSLRRLLGLDDVSETRNDNRRTVHQGLLVIRRNEVRAVCRADEVHGIHRYHKRQLADVPATVGKAGTRHSMAVMQWEGRSVGVLDDDALFQALQRSMA
jgi:chemotaxis-related protein WspD